MILVGGDVDEAARCVDLQHGVFLWEFATEQLQWFQYLLGLGIAFSLPCQGLLVRFCGGRRELRYFGLLVYLLDNFRLFLSVFGEFGA